jgi:hypothetical protein
VQYLFLFFEYIRRAKNNYLSYQYVFTHKGLRIELGFQVKKMKKLILIILLFSVVEGIKAQNNKKIDIDKLTKLFEKSVFTDFIKFTSQLEYIVLDSSKDANGSIFYFTKEPILHGSTLACSTDPGGKKIYLLTYTTFNTQDYLDLKTQLKKSGFTSPGLNKSDRLPIIESQDFEKGKIIVATAIRKDNDGTITYEFTFIK